MEQIYMVEIMIDKISVFPKENENTAGKNLIIKINFGPKTQMILKEGLLKQNNIEQPDVIKKQKSGERSYTRTIRVGKSFMFPSYPDLMLMELSRCPLAIEIWNDDATEEPIFVGSGKMDWDPEFYERLQETSTPRAEIDPIAVKQVVRLMAECCCKTCAEITFILRVTALGKNIITEFQQPIKYPDSFVFQTNKSPNMYKCKKVDGDNPDFCMVGTLYETNSLENPEITRGGVKKIEICTQFQTCGLRGSVGEERVCQHPKKMQHTKKLYPIDKLRIGDIRGPCGNTNCSLAHKVRTYIRNLDTYKNSKERSIKNKKESSKKTCGSCICKDDTWHRDVCNEHKNDKKDVNSKLECDGCGKVNPEANICGERKPKLFDNITNTLFETIYDYFPLKKTTYDVNYKVQSVFVENDWPPRRVKNKNGKTVNSGASSCNNLSINRSGTKLPQDSYSYDNITSYPSNKTIAFDNDQSVNFASQLLEFSDKNQQANFDSFSSKFAINRDRTYQVYNFCTDIPDDKDCHCNPPVPPVPCKTFNCDCIAEIGRKMSRKIHKPYCPSYSHKPNCPVNLTHEDEDENKEEEEEVVPLPYGLPPVKLGPCPILGKPCTYPDGFSRMYKVGAMANQPQSYSDAGKVCCSKEYERIKKAIQEYMLKPKGHDERCKNKYIIDTETRCCDHEQRLFSLQGKECCGRHKMELKDLYMKKDKEKS